MRKRTGLRKLGKGLAGAVAIASGTTAYGAIVVVNPPADLTNSPGGANTTTTWDVNSDGTADFLFNNRYPNTSAGNGVIWQQNMNPATGALAATNGIISYLGPFVRYAFALPAGINVGPTDTRFSTVTQVVLGSRYLYGSAPYYYGGFAAGPDGAANGAVSPGTFAFVGFRFNAADGTHFGYLRLAVNAGIIDFDNVGAMRAAYQSTPNAAIMTGAVPEPGTMALLALGAAGVLGTVVKRRRA
jgi:hypothetical protein